LSRSRSSRRSGVGTARLLRPAIAALTLWGLVLHSISPTSAAADTEHVSSDSPEAWAMFYFTSVTVFSGLGTPRAREPWSVDFALELGNIPHLDTEERRVGFHGTKVENLNNSPILARPILTFGLPWSTSLSLAYIPPIRVLGVKPNLFAMAIERPIYERGPWSFGARLHGQLGKSKGAFTCPGYAARYEPGSDGNPYGCEGKSRDRVIQNYVGLELSGSYRIESLDDLTPYLTLGANYLDTEFHVRARTFGSDDYSKIAAEIWTFSLGTGLGYAFTDNTWVSLGVFYTPLTVDREPPASEQHESLVNVRAQVAYQLW